MLNPTVRPHRHARRPLRRVIVAAVVTMLMTHGGLTAHALAGGCGACDDDQDGLSNELEVAYGTRLATADSDGDGWSDGAEVLFYGSDPLDGANVPFILTGPGPRPGDRDGDGLSDADEPAIYTTSADDFDTDGDGRNDWAEIFVDGTNPRVGDTDGDGYGDFAEGVKGTNPLDPSDHPNP
jgi:thrombospondin type 3 repeat protein